MDEKGLGHTIPMGVDDALVALFVAAVGLAINPIPSVTREEAMDKLGELSAMEKRLLEDAAKLRALNSDPQIQGLFGLWLKHSNFPRREFQLGRLYDWTSLDHFAGALEALVTFFPVAESRYRPEGPRPVVDRKTAREEVRAYVFHLGKAFRTHFNSPLHKNIATITSVALKKKVSSEYVRKVLEATKK